MSGGSAIDERTTRHSGYAISQRKRKRVEESFGWLKTIALMRKVRHRGIPLRGLCPIVLESLSEGWLHPRPFFRELLAQSIEDIAELVRPEPGAIGPKRLAAVLLHESGQVIRVPTNQYPFRGGNTFFTVSHRENA